MSLADGAAWEEEYGEHSKTTVGDLLADLAKMEKDRDRWRRALNDCTPGGSEFANDPDFCREWVKMARNNMWETAKKNIIENQKFRKVLEDSIIALRMVRNGAGDMPELQTLARDIVNQLEELHVGRAKQSPDPRPDEPLNSIARKERL